MHDGLLRTTLPEDLPQRGLTTLFLQARAPPPSSITEGTDGPGQRRPDHINLFQDPRENAETTDHPGGSNEAGEETAQTIGENQYIHLVQETRVGDPGGIPPPPDYVEPGEPEAPPDPGDPGGTCPTGKRGTDPRGGKPDQGGRPDHDTQIDYVLGAGAETAGQPNTSEPATTLPPSTKASRPPQPGARLARATIPGVVGLGMMLLATTAKGFATQSTPLSMSGATTTNKTSRWHTPPNPTEPGIESGPRLEVILAILLTPLILKLATRFPHVGRARADRPCPSDRPPGVDQTDLTSARPRKQCALTGPAMLFIPHQWFRKGPEAEQCLLNVFRYCGHEFAAQQRADYTWNTFISLMFPTQGDVLPSEHLHQADPVELAAMIGCKGHYRIVRTPWTGSWALLTYGNRQVYVPASCRQSLLQAAHAAMHDGMGSTGYLLKKAFYWPTLAEDARQFTQACRAIHTTKAQRREQGPPPPPRDRNPEPEVEQKPWPARPRAGTRGRRPPLWNPTRQTQGTLVAEMDPDAGGNPHEHQRSDQPAQENEARLAGNEPPTGGPLGRAGPGPRSISAPVLELYADKTDLRERIERAGAALQAIRMQIRKMDNQAELTAEGDVPKPGYAVPGLRLRGCLH